MDAYTNVHNRVWCEAQIPGVCSGRVQHAHHRQLRSQGGRADLDNLIGVCDRCHWAIHNPSLETAERWAYHHGLLVPSWADPAVVRVAPSCSIRCQIDHTGLDALAAAVDTIV